MGLAGNESAHAFDGVGRDLAAEPKPSDELTVIDSKAAERRFGDADTPTIFSDVVQQRLTHLARPPLSRADIRYGPGVWGSTKILPTIKVGNLVGFIPLDACIPILPCCNKWL